MKEIKAYFNRSCVNRVVDELEKTGALGISIAEIHPVGYGYEPNYFEIQFGDAYKRYAYLRIIKLEVVCADHDVARMVQAIRNGCWSGSKDDGWIFITNVETGFRICDCASGEEVVAQEREPLLART